VTRVYVEAQGALSNAAATIFAANPARKGLIIGNPSDTAMTFRVGAAATATAGVPIPAGTAIKIDNPEAPTGLISLFCAGASKAYCAYEW
jgi:hypothetical protein